MSVSLEQYKRLKDRCDTLQTAADRAQGALDAALAKLAADYGCGSLAEAEALSVRLAREATAAEADYGAALAAFEAEWGDKLQ